MVSLAKKILWIAISIFLICCWSDFNCASAQTSPITLEFSVNVDRLSLLEGEEITGKVILRIYYNAPANTEGTTTKEEGEFQILADYGDGKKEEVGKCFYSFSKKDDYAECIYPFSHKYLKPGNYTLGILLQKNGSEVDRREFKIEVKSREITATPTSVADTLPSPLKSTSIVEQINSIFYNLIFKFIIFGVIGMLMIGGYFMIFSQGDPQRVQQGKKIIFYSLIGLILIIVAWGIIYFILNVLGVKNK
ncbi:MAG: hypothetical protein DRH24_16075 [Deltaproteobacteria bacterium]|nr:MAG: hypothetical protein DRH24_16075 [Deltaproteobacteria bacterium]